MAELVVQPDGRRVLKLAPQDVEVKQRPNGRRDVVVHVPRAVLEVREN